ncbi:hypothetical protein JCM19000A_00420 [Silvimonas sp. JCM 19000]
MTESGVKRASILLLASVSLLLVFVTGERYLRPVRAEVSPGITHEIPSTELPAVIAQANKGDLNATKRLAGYYLIARNDEISALPWMKKAAALGDKSAQHYVLDALNQSPDPNQHKEALSFSRQWGVASTP